MGQDIVSESQTDTLTRPNEERSDAAVSETQKPSKSKAASKSAQARADLRRKQILDAADKCFASHGFHGASMADLAAEAELSVGQIYRYFENKEAIIAAIALRDSEAAAQRVAAVRARAGDIVDQFMEVARYSMERFKDPAKAALTLEIMAESTRNPRVQEIVHDFSRRRRAVLIESIRRHGGGADQPCFEARLDILLVLLDGWLVRLVKDPTMDTESYLRSLERTLRFVLIEAPAQNQAQSPQK